MAICLVCLALFNTLISAKVRKPIFDIDDKHSSYGRQERIEILIKSESPFSIARNEFFDEIRIFYDDYKACLCLSAHVYEEPDYVWIDLDGNSTIIEGRKRIGPEFLNFECDVTSSFLKAFRKFANAFVAVPEDSAFLSPENYDGAHSYVCVENRISCSELSLYGATVNSVLWKIAMAIRFRNPQSIESSIPEIKELTKQYKKLKKKYNISQKSQ